MIGSTAAEAPAGIACAIGCCRRKDVVAGRQRSARVAPRARGIRCSRTQQGRPVVDRDAAVRLGGAAKGHRLVGIDIVVRYRWCVRRCRINLQHACRAGHGAAEIGGAPGGTGNGRSI